MKILMVCLGNICRSPMAEGVLRSKLGDLDVEIDSAGTSNYHEGDNPDARAVKTMRKKGIDISKLTARQFEVADFDRYDRIYAMDSSNYKNILNLARNEADKEKVEMFVNELLPGSNGEVPDPYFGGPDGFEEVYKLLDETTDRIIDKLKNGQI